MAEAEPIETQCPRCREWIEDLDGFGVLVHFDCGYCSHPSRTGLRCDICWHVEVSEAAEALLRAAQSLRGWSAEEIALLLWNRSDAGAVGDLERADVINWTALKAFASNIRTVQSIIGEDTDG